MTQKYQFPVLFYEHDRTVIQGKGNSKNAEKLGLIMRLAYL